MKWREPGKNLFFWQKTNKTPYCGIKNPCSAENQMVNFENVLSKYSILKISVHTDDIDSGATLSELNFGPSRKYWSHFTEPKKISNPSRTTSSVTFNPTIWLVPFKIFLFLFYNVCRFPLAIPTLAIFTLHVTWNLLNPLFDAFTFHAACTMWNSFPVVTLMHATSTL